MVLLPAVVSFLGSFPSSLTYILFGLERRKIVEKTNREKGKRK